MAADQSQVVNAAILSTQEEDITLSDIGPSIIVSYNNFFPPDKLEMLERFSNIQGRDIYDLHIYTYGA